MTDTAVPQGLEGKVDRLTDNVEALIEVVTNQARRTAELMALYEQQVVELRSMAGDLKGIRSFMRSHNTKLGELLERFDGLACQVGEPCPRKTPSSELKAVR